MYEDLERLNALKEKGAITEEEYQKEKKRILNNMEQQESSQPDSSQNATNGKRPLWGMDERGYCTLLHLSQFAGLLVPYAGYIMPIVMWVSGKDDSEAVDKHGKQVMNWVISMVIYSVVCGFLCMLLIGIPMLIALWVLNIIFVIKGTIAANKGEFWKYPMTLNFF